MVHVLMVLLELESVFVTSIGLEHIATKMLQNASFLAIVQEILPVLIRYEQGKIL